MREREFHFKKKLVNERRRAGIIILLIGIGIPTVLSFFQEDGELRFYKSQIIAQRNLTQSEAAEIKRAIEREKKQMGRMERIVEEVKGRYRKLAGKDLQKDRWVLQYNKGFSVPFKYLIALGILMALVGLGKIIVG